MLETLACLKITLYVQFNIWPDQTKWPWNIQIGHQEGGKFTRTESQNSLHCHQARQDGIDKKWVPSTRLPPIWPNFDFGLLLTHCSALWASVMKVPKALAKFWWLVGLWNLGLCYTVRTVRSIAVQGQSIFDHNGMVNGFCLCTIVFNGFSMVANHWSSDSFSIARPTIGPNRPQWFCGGFWSNNHWTWWFFNGS